MRDGEIEADDEFGIGCILQPGELWNAQSEFRSLKHREIDRVKCERCERKRSIQFSSVASK